MEIGAFTFAEATGDHARRLRELVEEGELADQVGLDVFGVGEHHRPDFAVSSPAVALAAIAARTQRIRLTSAVTVLSSDDPADPVERARLVVGPPPRAAARRRRLPAARARSAPGVDRRRRQPRVGGARGSTGPAARRGDHRRRARALRARGGPVPPCGERGRSRRRGPAREHQPRTPTSRAMRLRPRTTTSPRTPA